MEVLNRILTVSEETLEIATEAVKFDAAHHGKMATKHITTAMKLGPDHADYMTHIQHATDHMVAKKDIEGHTDATKLLVKARSTAANKRSQMMGISLESDAELDKAFEALAETGSPVLTRMQQAAVTHHHNQFVHHNAVAMDTGTADEKHARRHMNAATAHMKAMWSHVHQHADRMKHSDEADTKTSIAHQKLGAVHAIGESAEDAALESDADAQKKRNMLDGHKSMFEGHMTKQKKTGDHHFNAMVAHADAHTALTKGEPDAEKKSKHAFELTKKALDHDEGK